MPPGFFSAATIMLIDTHAHLDDSRFADDCEAVITRAKNAGVMTILTIGIDRDTSHAAVRLAETHPEIFAVVGIQPNCVAEATASDWEDIQKIAAHPKVLALGETGLDRYWNRAPLPLQEDYFHRHLELSRALGKPVVIHCRDAEADVVQLLQREWSRTGPIAGVMHSFTGSWPTAEACFGMGLMLSFAGMVTYKSAANLREVAQKVPEDRLLIETDAPYLAPVPVRGQRNEPAFLVHAARLLADVRGVSFDTLAMQTTRNARRLFAIPQNGHC